MKNLIEKLKRAARRLASVASVGAAAAGLAACLATAPTAAKAAGLAETPTLKVNSAASTNLVVNGGYWPIGIAPAAGATNVQQIATGGARYLNLQIDAALTTASTSNSIALIPGANLSGIYNASYLTGMYVLPTIKFQPRFGTATDTFVTNYFVGGIPYIYLGAFTNDNSAGGTAGLTNYSVRYTLVQ